jgi:L-ribulose-5-phosphate 3-epimerase
MDLGFFLKLEKVLFQNRVSIAFETDLDAVASREFIQTFNPQLFGINYDIGNSASLGFDPEIEISNYGERILNVHVKDRILHGQTVPLGSGNADFRTVAKELKKFNFCGNFILQTARASDGEHAFELMRNFEFFERVLIEN